MKVLQHAAQCSREEGPICAAIGFFDGLHLGHQQVIRCAMAEAQELRGQAVVITFDRHPLQVVNPLRAPIPEKSNAFSTWSSSRVQLQSPETCWAA